MLLSSANEACVADESKTRQTLAAAIKYLHINSKADSTQMAFYTAIATTMRKSPIKLTTADYADDLNLILERLGLSTYH